MNGVFGTVDGNWKACATGSSCVSCPPSVPGRSDRPRRDRGATSTGSGPDGGTIPPITSEAPDSIS